MKGRITIELDFDFGTPYILVKNDKTSDDVRDKLISFFRQKLGHTSSWCRVKFNDYALPEDIFFEIHPITPQDLKEQSEIMAEQARLNKESLKIPTPITI